MCWYGYEGSGEEMDIPRQDVNSRKIVIHPDLGVFWLSYKAYKRLIELGVAVQKYGTEAHGPVIWDRGASVGVDRYSDNLERDDPLLIKVVEELGEDHLKIVEIPFDVKWHIANYNGEEWVAEDHRVWK